jgi:hypothetical protein
MSCHNLASLPLKLDHFHLNYRSDEKQTNPHTKEEHQKDIDYKEGYK